MAISFEAIGERMVTFAAGTGLKEGKVCKMTANGTVGACGKDDSFIGVVSSVRGGAANVVMGGYVEVSYAGTTTPALGYAVLVTDENGEVVLAAAGRTCLVVHVDAANKKIGLFL